MARGLRFGRDACRIASGDARASPSGTDPDFNGDPAWIRTRDLQLRRLLLYPLSYGAVLADKRPRVL